MNLNSNNVYGFDDFIIGKSNKKAYEMCMNVVNELDNPQYNLLYIYGDSGLGKTHLLHSIENYVQKSYNKNLLCIDSSDFIKDYVDMNNSEKDDLVKEFNDKYRNLDILIIDNIQYFRGAKNTQIKFLDILDNLLLNNKQVVISSNNDVNRLELNDCLKTKINNGIKVEIKLADMELKRDYIKKKIAEMPFESVTDEVIEFIALNSKDNIHHISGAITRITAYATINGIIKIDLEIAKLALKDYINYQ